MSINEVIIAIMVFFMIIGAVDKLLGNRFGYGQKFVDGFMAMGSLALAMVGIVSLAPVLAKLLLPVVVPVYKAVGADPAMFATTLLAIDMGGYSLAMELAESPEAGVFAGVMLGTMMGPTIVFTIPVALGIIEKQDHPFLAQGILIGIMTIPLGSLVGGIVAGFDVGMILQNLLPVLLFALFIAIGLWKMPKQMIRGFQLFGKLVEITIMTGLIAIVFETLMGIVIIPGMTPLSEGIVTAGMIAIMLAGAFPMVYFITKVFRKPLIRLGKRLGIGDIAMAGVVASLAHSIPMFAMLKEMDHRGKVINVAFAVSGAFVLGGHLGFVAGVQKEMILAMMLGKLTAGISAIILALLLTKKEKI